MFCRHSWTEWLKKKGVHYSYKWCYKCGKVRFNVWMKG